MHRGRIELAHIPAPMSSTVHSNGAMSQVKTVKMIEAMLLSPIIKPNAQPTHEEEHVNTTDHTKGGSPIHDGTRQHPLKHIDVAEKAGKIAPLIAGGGRSDAVSPQPYHKGHKATQLVANATEAQYMTMVQTPRTNVVPHRSKTPPPQRKVERQLAEYLERMRFHCNGCVVKKIGGGFSVVGISDGHGNCIECHRPIDYDCETNANLNLARLDGREFNLMDYADVSKSEGNSPGLFGVAEGLVSPSTEHRPRKAKASLPETRYSPSSPQPPATRASAGDDTHTSPSASGSPQHPTASHKPRTLEKLPSEKPAIQSPHHNDPPPSFPTGYKTLPPIARHSIDPASHLSHIAPTQVGDGGGEHASSEPIELLPPDEASLSDQKDLVLSSDRPNVEGNHNDETKLNGSEVAVKRPNLSTDAISLVRESANKRSELSHPPKDSPSYLSPDVPNASHELTTRSPDDNSIEFKRKGKPPKKIPTPITLASSVQGPPETAPPHSSAAPTPTKSPPVPEAGIAEPSPVVTSLGEALPSAITSSTPILADEIEGGTSRRNRQAMPSRRACQFIQTSRMM